MKKSIVTIVLLPLLAFAQSGELVVGEQTVTYDSATTTEAGTLYYAGETIVGFETEGVTLVFENDQVILEAHDTTGDGVLDAFLTLDMNDEVINRAGEGAGAFTRPEVVEFSALVGERGAGEAGAPLEEEDLVGSLDSITIPGYRNYTLYLWMLILAGVGYWYYRKRQKQEG